MKIKVGQIGIGHNHGKMKFYAFKQFPELFEVVGFSEDNPDWLEKRGDLDVYKGFKNYPVEELIDMCDALIIECDVKNLTKYALMCVNKGKHIHMDKPASGSLEEFKEVLDIAKEKNLVVQMGYMYRYNPAVLKTFELIEEGKLGEILSINAEMSTYHGKPYKEWLSTFEGGIMYILGSHFVDLIVKMMGKPDKITSFLKHTGFEGVDVCDNNLAVLEFGNALARIFVSSVEVNGWGRRQLVVSGTKGTVNIVPMENPCIMTYSGLEIAKDYPYMDKKEIIEIPDVPKNNRYDTMVSDFYEYIKVTKTNPYTYEHDYLVQKVLYEIIGGIPFGYSI